MKLKRFFLVISLILCAGIFFACSVPTPEPSGLGGDSQIADGAETTVDSTNRKIIYTYGCDLYTDDLEQTIKTITDALSNYSGAYIEHSQKNSGKNAQYTLRVRSEDLNAFVADIKTAGTAADETLNSEDVTKNYLDLAARKASKEAELARLTELYDKANTIGELAEIAGYIARVESELNSINSALSSYDSLVTLSKVNINIYKSKPPKKGYGNQFTTAVKNSGRAIVTFFKYLLIVIVYVLPFAALAAAIGVPVLVVIKKREAKKRAEKNKKDDKPNL